VLQQNDILITIVLSKSYFHCCLCNITTSWTSINRSSSGIRRFPVGLTGLGCCSATSNLILMNIAIPVGIQSFDFTPYSSVLVVPQCLAIFFLFSPFLPIQHRTFHQNNVLYLTHCHFSELFHQSNTSCRNCNKSTYCRNPKPIHTI